MAKKRKATPARRQPEPTIEPEEEEETSSSEDDDVEETSSSGDEEEEETSSTSSSEEEDETDESSKRETLRKLLEPFNKDKIIDILREGALNDSSIFTQIKQFADSDPSQRKIFVYRLAWDVTVDQLHQAFQPFGEIEECKLITDKATGRAKGYAFVIFKTRSAAKKALKNPQKKIGNRIAGCQLASSGPPGTSAGGVPDLSNRKLYVGNVGLDVGAEEIRAFFSKFGEIEEGPSGFDYITNKSKGFAIFVYKTEEGCKKALEEPTKTFNGCKIYCKRFVENTSNNSSGNIGNRNQGGQMGVGDVNYGIGVTQGIMGPSLNAGGVFMGQNQGMGLAGNPIVASVMNPMLAAQNQGTGLSGIGGNYGINSISPSVIGAYSSQAALQGFGAYPYSQMGQSSASETTPGTAVGVPKAQSTAASAGTTFPSYFGR